MKHEIRVNLVLFNIQPELKDYDELRRDANMTPAEMRQRYKRDNVQPPREFTEVPLVLSSTSKL